MKLQLNTGKNLKFWYVPQNINFVTGINSGQSVLIGPMDFVLDSNDSSVSMNISLLATSSTENLVTSTDKVTLRILRNSDSSNPIFEESFSFRAGQSYNHIDFNFIDSQPLANSPINKEVNYTLILILTLTFGTCSYTINSFNFSEIESPSLLPVSTS